MTVAARGRAVLRDAAHASGALTAWHRGRNRATLTVLMFHRVVEPGTPQAARADPVYAVPAPLFAACLRFCAAHYAIVGLAEVQAARAGGPPLPPRALLITFDDGWADNRDVALPLLRAADLPCVIFVAADALADPTPWWWQEILLRAVREQRASLAALWAGAGGAGAPPQGDEAPLHLLHRFTDLAPSRREAILAPLLDAAAAEGRHMLRPDDLPRLVTQGAAIGGHGAAHLPLTLLADPAADLARARRILRDALPADPAALSFPHGRYGAASLRAARQAGYDLLFTSDACLNAAPGGRPSGLLGRISVQAGGISDEAGALAPARLATWLFNRPIRTLHPPAA